MSASKGPTFFPHHFFHHACGWPFVAVKETKGLVEFSVKQIKSAATEERERQKKGIFFCKRTVRIEAESKVIQTNFLKIERRTHLGAVEWRKRDSDKSKEVIRTLVLKYILGAEESKKNGSERDVR